MDSHEAAEIANDKTHEAVYDPLSIRPAPNPGDSALSYSPWSYYYHNLSPFGNYAVNRAYFFWDHYYIHPPHVGLLCLLDDCSSNASRGEMRTGGWV
jgi:hypothetical protein